MHNYARLGAWGILALIALRIGIGWHFYYEGRTKISSGKFSSAGFLQASAGPLADQYKQLIWDNDGKIRLDQGLMNGLFEKAGKQASEHFVFTAEQNKQLTKLNADWHGLSKNGETYRGKLNSAFADNAEEIHKFKEGIARLKKMQDADLWDGVGSLHGQKQSIAKDRETEIASVLKSMDMLWKRYERELNMLATPEQFAASKYFRIQRPNQGPITLRTVDKILPYFDVVVGILLILGCFTSLAGWAAGLFLISVVLSQMPGYAGTAPTYFQAVEALGCIVVATTGAGKFAGLDFIGWSYFQNRKAAKG